MAKKIYAFWFKDWLNLGDMAGLFILKNICPLEIVYKDPRIRLLNEIKTFVREFLKRRLYLPNFRDYIYPWQSCICTIGSMIDFATSRTCIWGAGFRSYESNNDSPTYYAVRGKLSLEKISKDCVTAVRIGDPAVLLPIIYEGKYNYKKVDFSSLRTIKIIAHKDDYQYLYKKFGNKYEFISLSTSNVVKFIQDIKQCDCILSSSLHGLIIPHSFGIPALWIYNSDIGTDDFKFHDYFSSVGIEKYNGYRDLDRILASNENWQSLFSHNSMLALPDMKLIETLAMGLLSCAPFPLRDKYKNMYDF